MPRVDGIYSPPAGTKGTPNTVIQSSKYNALVDDLVADLNAARPVTAGGTNANNATDARENLGANNASNLIKGTVDDARLPGVMTQKLFSGPIIARDQIFIDNDGDRVAFFRNAAGLVKAAIINQASTGNIYVRLFSSGDVFRDFVIPASGSLMFDGAAVWTSANDGADSGLDADLLDGQQGSWYADIAGRLGYTPLNQAAYTADDVLAKIKTVDGEDCGLDADLLDGQHGSFFRNASNLENGTVPDERLPTRLRFSAELITDWNDAQSNGWYRGDPAALNSPAAGEWWIGEVQLNEYNAWVFQKVHSFTSAGVETYKRVMQAGIWKPWRRVYETEAEIREASKMVSLPAVPATGAAIDWTSIPSDVEEIELWFDGISINGGSGLLVQVGTGGVLQTSGYQSGSYLGGNTRQTSTSGITIRLDTAFYLKTGVLRLVRSSDNRWLSYHVVGDVTTGYTVMGGGHVTLTGGLDTIRLRAVDAAQTLDAGSVQLRYRR